MLAHLAPALVAALTTASWFRPGEFFARGDIPPFERRAPLAEVLSLWGHQFSPAGGPSYLLARLPELAAGALGDWTGVGPEAAQRLFFAAVAGAVAGAAAYFASALVRRPAAIAAVGLLAFFNPLTLQRLPNVLTLWAVLTMALVGGVVLRAAAGAAMRPVALGLASLPSCYLALNPPLLVVAIGWVPLLLVVAALGWGRPGLRRASGLVARSTPWVVILNLWWAVPFALVLASARASSALGAETSVSSWSWTHAASSLGNVVTLSGSWAWRSPDYFPYAAALDRPPSGTLKLGLPLLAASGVLLARPARRVVLALAAVAVPLVLLGKGLHPPLAGVNRFLYDHVPAMYLLREPLGKVGPPLLLLLLGMGALALEHAGRGVGGRIEARRWAVAVPVVLALAGLAYPRPLWTGEVVVAASGRLPPASVELPEDWRAVGRHLDASGRHGKVLVLPLDDFYQMPTTWGFYGADVIPRWLTGRTTIQPLPESYLADPEAHRRLVDRAQAALLARDLDEVPRVLRALGASEVVLRKDLDTGFPDRRIVDHRDLSPALERTPGLSRTLANDVATVYRVDDGDRPVYLADGVIGAVDEERDTADLVAASPHRGAVVRPGSGRTGHVLRPPAREVSFETGGGPHILDKGLVEGSIVEMAPAADGAALEIRDVAPVVLDGRPALAAPEGRVALPEGSEPAAVVGQRLVRIPGPPARAVMRTGDHVATFDLGDRSRAGTELSPVQDCHARDRLSLSEAGIEAAPIAEHGPAVLLRARAHAACVSLALPQAATSPAVHRVTLEYRTVSGRPARLCLFE
ncbi:MAG TPA: hypothetical protein VFO65_06915, partial [Acidimicrobiales bacterium]|nr:hypothetical protein [Acidimicrobiales bacterium]